MRRSLPTAALVFLLAIAFVLLVAACGGEETVSPAPEDVEGTIAQQTVAEGDADAGKAVFTAQGCGSCHTYKAAGTTGTVGPDLDEGLKGKDAQYILNSIVSPDAEVTEGFNPGIMPKTYGQALSEKELADLVAFLKPKS